MRTVSGDPETAARAAEGNAAYEILGDPERRAHFDNKLRQHPQRLDGQEDLAGGALNADANSTMATFFPPSRVRGKRKDALYCSNACRQRAYRARKAALKRLPPGESKNADP
jgi:curved DNA-binding protein CbpA